MAFFTWKKVNAQVLSVSACVKEWSKQQPGILKEFAAKEAVWKAAIVDVYNGASGAEKVILRNPTEDVIKANPEDAQKLISQLSGKGIPGFRFLDVNVPKLGVGPVSMPVAAAFRPVAGLLPPEESAVRMPVTVADSPVAKAATVGGWPATVPTSTPPAAATGTNDPDSKEAEIAPEDDVIKAGQTSTSSMAEAEKASTNITDEELPDAGQASTSAMDDEEAMASENSGAATEEKAPGAVSHQTPPKAEAGVKVLDKGAVGLSLIERQASIHDDYVKLDSDTIAMFLQEHGEEEDGEGGDGFSGAAKSFPGTPAGAIMRPTSKATAPSNVPETAEASPTESARGPSPIDQLAESTSSTSAAVPFQPKGVVEDLLSDAFAAVEEAGGDTSVVGDRVAAVAAAPLAATPESLKGRNAVTTSLERVAVIPAHVVVDAKDSLGVAAEVTKEVFQQKVDDEVKNVIATHAEMPVKQAVSSLDEKPATSVTVPAEVAQFPMAVEDSQTLSAMKVADTDDKEEIWADAEAVMRDDFDVSSAENSRTASPAKVSNSRTASPAKLKPEGDTETTPAKVAAGDAVGTPVKVSSVGAKVAFFDAVMSPAKLSFRESGAALAKVASDDPVFSLGKSPSGETASATPAKKASNDAVGVLKGLPKDEALGSAVLVKVSASELHEHATKDCESSEPHEHAMKDSEAEVEVSATAKPEITKVLNAAAAAAHNIGLARTDEDITSAAEDGGDKRAQEDTKIAVEDAPLPATLETAAGDTLEELLPVATKTAVEMSPLPEVINTAVEGVLLPEATKAVVKVDDTSLPAETKIADEETSAPAVTETAGADATVSAAAETAAEDTPMTPVKTSVKDTPVEVEATPLSASAKAAEGEGDEKAAPESGGKVQNIIKKIFGGGRSRESSPRAEASPSPLAVEKLGISSGLVSKGVAVMESLAQEQSPPKEKEALAASGSGAVSSESSEGMATVAVTTAESKDKDAVPVATSLSTPLKEASTSAFPTPLKEAPISAFSSPLKEAPTSAFSTPLKEAPTSALCTPLKEAPTSAFSTPLKEAATSDTAPSLATPAAAKEVVKVSANGATQVAEEVADTKAGEESDEVSLTPRDAAAPVAEPAIMTQFAGLAPEAGSEASEATESILPGGQGAVSTAADSCTASTGTASSDVKGIDESASLKIPAVASGVSDKHVAGETAPLAVEAHVVGETAPLAVDVLPAKTEKLEVSAGDEKQTGDTLSHADEAKVIPAKATPVRVSSKHRRSLSSTLFSRFIEKERSEPLAETVKDVETLTPIVPPKRRRNSSSLFGCFSKPKVVQ